MLLVKMKFVVVLILLFLIFILINTTKSPFLNVYNGNHWNNYRLGDVILMPRSSRFYDPDNHENVLYHTTDYPGSIAAEYIRESKKHKDFKLLNKIINKRNNLEKVEDHTLILHIRVGDVICKKVWIDNAKDHYSKIDNTFWWNNVIKYIKNNGITKVVIIAGTHFKDCIEESGKYILDRGNYLINNGLKVEYRLGKSPDDDLIFSSNAKHFITTGGGYGELIKMINKNKSGN
jgi:hypothetical protein